MKTKSLAELGVITPATCNHWLYDRGEWSETIEDHPLTKGNAGCGADYEFETKAGKLIVSEVNPDDAREYGRRYRVDVDMSHFHGTTILVSDDASLVMLLRDLRAAFCN